MEFATLRVKILELKVESFNFKSELASESLKRETVNVVTLKVKYETLRLVVFSAKDFVVEVLALKFFIFEVFAAKVCRARAAHGNGLCVAGA